MTSVMPAPATVMPAPATGLLAPSLAPRVAITVTLDAVETHEGEPDGRPRVRLTVVPAGSA
ncbi:hypothetical protein [Herbiconiux sp.]|uniref:hypothetical protein n=1 Tax=Herbiconiux sp. TaxID=1871186 RepID=UPI0025C1C695|nr:hypothetical protein [Herbiconiux sp.]